KLIGKTVNQVRSTPGRLTYSVAQASFDAWTRYYRPDENTANATVSYYTKGSLVALALDLSLRLGPPRADGAIPSLDGVMARLWALQRPITQADVAQVLHDEATAPPRHARDWGTLLDRWVHGTDDLPLQDLLEAFAVRWTDKTGSASQQLGLRAHETPQGLKAQSVMHGSPAEQAGLSAGDELIALDGWRLKRPDDLNHFHHGSREQSLLICRDQRLMTLTLPVPGTGTSPWNHTVLLTLKDGAHDPQVDLGFNRRKAWLGC
ncbi:MAG TPA: PDZ domain-containing protein, partial [Aquabacterium sp.]|nr:PDZ domain-containing protein [Aquabacterium sp.]